MPRLVSAAASPALPAYQPPSCPLSDKARRSLGQLAAAPGERVYQTHLSEAHRHLSSAVGDFNEILKDQLERRDFLRQNRVENGRDKSRKESLLDEYIARYAPQADALTLEAERAVRDVIDRQAALEDQDAVLNDVLAAAATQQPPTARRRGNEDDENNESSESNDNSDKNNKRNENKDNNHGDHEEPPPTNLLHTFRKGRADKLSQYTNLTPHQRYGLNNDYTSFKKIWFDSVCPDGGPPLPDASRWFRSDGTPVMDRPDDAAQLASDADDDDDDIAVAREVLSVNCPLTLRTMVEPYSNKKCKHTFEKSAIREYVLQARGEVQCPQTGCNQKFTRQQFDKDFFLDHAMQRRIQRVQASSEHYQHDHDDDSVNHDEPEIPPKVEESPESE